MHGTEIASKLERNHKTRDAYNITKTQNWVMLKCDETIEIKKQKKLK